LRNEYWQVAADDAELELDEALDRLDKLLRESIAACIPDTPWAMYLSGGVDSAIIAAVAKPDLCFTCNFPYGPKYDELHYAQAVASHVGAELVVVRPTQPDFERSLDDIVYHLEMPVASFSAFPLYFLAQAASEHGIGTILSGEGADELFSGYARHLIIPHENRLYDVPPMRNYGSLLAYYFGSALDRFSHLLSRCDGMDHVVRDVIAPHFERFDDVVHAMGYTEFKVLLPTILHMEHCMAAAFGIQNRNPFLDRRIIQFAFSIPSRFKIRGYETKHLVRALARRYLPQDVVERQSKMGLVFPYGLWFPSGGVRGEFDRSAYNRLCYERWHRIFFEERRWA
jgi:asparagine synthase (glutamine-hydrolysing)